MVETMNISHWNLHDLGTAKLGSLAHFVTKTQAMNYAKSIGWFKADVRRIHARMHGYLWIITDLHTYAVMRPV